MTQTVAWLCIGLVDMCDMGNSQNNMETKSSTPVIVKQWQRSFLLGAVYIEYHVEDRRPDLEVGEYDGKYKHFLTMFIVGKRLNWTFRTTHPYEDLPCED